MLINNNYVCLFNFIWMSLSDFYKDKLIEAINSIDLKEAMFVNNICNSSDDFIEKFNNLAINTVINGRIDNYINISSFANMIKLVLGDVYTYSEYYWYKYNGQIWLKCFSVETLIKTNILSFIIKIQKLCILITKI